MLRHNSWTLCIHEPGNYLKKKLFFYLRKKENLFSCCCFVVKISSDCLFPQVNIDQMDSINRIAFWTSNSIRNLRWRLTRKKNIDHYALRSRQLIPMGIVMLGIDSRERINRFWIFDQIDLTDLFRSHLCQDFFETLDNLVETSCHV
jgi:hypothetical protein